MSNDTSVSLRHQSPPSLFFSHDTILYASSKHQIPHTDRLSAAKHCPKLIETPNCVPTLYHFVESSKRRIECQKRESVKIGVRSRMEYVQYFHVIWGG